MENTESELYLTCNLTSDVVVAQKINNPDAMTCIRYCDFFAILHMLRKNVITVFSICDYMLLPETR